MTARGGSERNTSLLPVWILGFAGGLQAHQTPCGASLARQTPTSWQTYVLSAHRREGCRPARSPARPSPPRQTQPAGGTPACCPPITRGARTRAPQALRPCVGPVCPSPQGDGDHHGGFCPAVPCCCRPLPATVPGKTDWAPPGVCVPDLQDLPPLPGSTLSSFQAPFFHPKALAFGTCLLSRAQALGFPV